MPTVLIGDENGISTASFLLQSGKPVVIPTETVYGLAANALDTDAVAEIFRIKGRPPSNPLIVHVGDLEVAGRLGVMNERAFLLANAFWPGPLTIVVSANDRLPQNVTAGGTTVGLRMPSHPLTLRLLEKSGLALAAPSANKSEGISPTTVLDVVRSLGDLSPPIIDGGPCAVGIESTVIDVTTTVPTILRPGAVTRERLCEVLQEEIVYGASEGVQRSPGQSLRHYAPKAHVHMGVPPFLGLPDLKKTALLYFGDTVCDGDFSSVASLPADPTGYAMGLYAALNLLDRDGIDLIVIEEPPDREEWLAVRDRLNRASAPKRG